jgi:uncharacterized protein YbaP (TraB family)
MTPYVISIKHYIAYVYNAQNFCMNTLSSLKLLLKISTLLLFLQALSFNGFSQQGKGYNLLWEISGNGLKKPSYLFGSVHVKDRRVFNFSDSVMKAMDASSAFVMEIHPDSLTKSLLETGSLNRSNSKKQLLTEEQTQAFRERYEIKNGTLPDSSALNNPMMIASVMKADYSKPDDMETFLDAYLYGIARTLKKQVYGLEKTKDQIKLLFGENGSKISEVFDRDDEADQEQEEKLINVYSHGNIEEISNFLKDDALDRFNVDERNKGMVTGILSMLKKHNLFVAVGVAHLPGDQGIIALLRKSGYKLRPVQAAFTGVASSYTIDYSRMNWISIQDTVNNYSVEVPSTPHKALKVAFSTISVSSDIVSGNTYSTLSNYSGPPGMEVKTFLDTVMNSIKDNLKMDMVNKKYFEKDGAQYLEAELKGNGKFVKTLVVFRNDALYSLTVENPRNKLSGVSVDRFFNSLKFTAPKVNKSGAWVNYKNVAGAFSVLLPVTPLENIQEIPNPTLSGYPPYKIMMYMATDKVNLVNYLIRYNDYPAGVYLTNETLAYESMFKEFSSKGKIIGSPKKIYKDGYEGQALDLSISGFLMHLQIFVKGNRIYLLLKQSMKESEVVKKDQFFESFHIGNSLPYKSNPITVGNLQLNMPKDLFLVPKAANDYSSWLKKSIVYFGVNENSGGIYGVQSSILSKYYRNANVDSLYKKVLELNPEVDSLYKTETIKIGSINGKEYYSKSKLSGLYSRQRILINKDQVSIQSVRVSKEELLSATVKNFFTNSKYKGEARTYNLGISKASLLLENLRSNDTLIYNNALGAFKSYYHFDKKELPLIYAALKLKYSTDTSDLGVRAALIQELRIVNNDQAPEILKELYLDTKNTDLVRAIALPMIANLNKSDLDWYFKALVKNQPPKVKSNWRLFEPLADSIPYAASHLDQLVTLLDHKQYRLQVLGLISQVMSMKDTSGGEQLYLKFKDKIGAYALKDLEDYTAAIEYEEGADESLLHKYLTILPKLKLSKLTDEFTTKILNLDSARYLKTSAFAARVRTNLSLEKVLLHEQLDSLYTRYEIMEAFNDVGKLDSVPLKYRELAEFGKLLMYNYLGEDYSYPKEISLLGSVKDEKGVYYVYNLSYLEDGIGKNYLGVCGPFNGQLDKLNFDDYTSFADFKLKEEDWLAQAKTLIESMNKE